MAQLPLQRMLKQNLVQNQIAFLTVCFWSIQACETSCGAFINASSWDQCRKDGAGFSSYISVYGIDSSVELLWSVTFTETLVSRLFTSAGNTKLKKKAVMIKVR